MFEGLMHSGHALILADRLQQKRAYISCLIADGQPDCMSEQLSSHGSNFWPIPRRQSPVGMLRNLGRTPPALSGPVASWAPWVPCQWLCVQVCSGRKQEEVPTAANVGECP